MNKNSPLNQRYTCPIGTDAIQWVIAQVPRIVGSRRMGPAGQVDGKGDPVSVGTRAKYLCVGLSIFPRQTARSGLQNTRRLRVE